MKVGVLGLGDVAKALADGFTKHGHHVVMGTRDPSKLKAWGGQHRVDRVGSFADAANFGELVVLAVKGTAAPDALRAAGMARASLSSMQRTRSRTRLPSTAC
jgi:8-hydroxy-5-deazaflavin:NADPH oxidoreductase